MKLDWRSLAVACPKNEESKYLVDFYSHPSNGRKDPFDLFEQFHLEIHQNRQQYYHTGALNCKLGRENKVPNHGQCCSLLF